MAKEDLSAKEFETLCHLARRVLWENHDTRRRVQAHGINIVPANFYSEIPTFDELDGSFEYAEAEPFAAPMFDPDRIAAFVTDTLLPYAAEFAPPRENPTAPRITEFFWKCPAFSACDAMAYYCMIRHVKPQRIVEIGSGYSTLVALEAVRRNGFGEVVCVEPYPKDWLADLPIRLVRDKVQNLGRDFFDAELSDGDILFIDSTHTVKNGSDVLHIYLRILPFLAQRLAVHVHDIYLPYPLPKRSATETQIYWTEQYLLYAYLLDNPKIEVRYSAVQGVRRATTAMKALMDGKWPVGGSSFWFDLNGR